MIALPVLEGAGLTVEVVGQNLTWPFQLCMKLHVASPPAAGAQMFAKTGYCAPLFTFAPAQSATNKRSAHALARRNNVAVWTATQPAVDGHFFATIVGSSAAVANTTITLNLSGTTCAAANHYGPNCVQPAQLTAGTALFSKTAGAGQTLLQLNNAPINATTGAVQVSINKLSNVTATLYARFAAPPTTTDYDLMGAIADGLSVTTVNSPRQGSWFFLLANGDNTTELITNTTVSLVQCGAAFGPQCNIAPALVGAAGVVTALNNITQGGVAYFRMGANVSLAIAAAVNDPQQHGPSLFAKLGSLPTETDFDAVDCSVTACSVTQRTLIVPAADVWSAMQSSEWFVLVKSNDVGGVSVWNANGCANNCTNGDQGTCDAATSMCTCKANYQAFDCGSNKNALERWEWALIIGSG